MQSPHPADAWAARQLARASYFAVCRFRGAGRYDTRRFAALAEARAYIERRSAEAEQAEPVDE